MWDPKCQPFIHKTRCSHFPFICWSTWLLKSHFIPMDLRFRRAVISKLCRRFEAEPWLDPRSFLIPCCSLSIFLLHVALASQMTLLLMAREKSLTAGRVKWLGQSALHKNFHAQSFREKPFPFHWKGLFIRWKYDRGIINPMCSLPLWGQSPHPHRINCWSQIRSSFWSQLGQCGGYHLINPCECNSIS